MATTDDLVGKALLYVLALKEQLDRLQALDHYQARAAMETMDDIEAWLRSLAEPAH